MTQAHAPRGRRALAFGIAAGAVYLAMTCGPLARLEEISGLVAFDLRPGGYTVAEAHALLEALGAEGREIYLGRQLVLDLFFPALLALMMVNLYRLTGGPGVRGGVTLSLLAAACDYAENAGVAAMLLLWPEVPEALILASSAVTVVKSLATTLAVIGLLALFVLGRVRWAG